ncbi:o-succinylbenzoate synthase [Ignavibacterium sp.]|uniref:o-succinylbenzoate synthase n=1 Tax=Ignavibacterium sp. TaxID=2651167 RepID=UPI0021FE77A4|nr:o-succinylbenzoate synthase [Ignavibacterium sp.]BDQ03151.1 MAG: o-succinylbenzoate synthase [Ignavibacterium sp.]
MKIEKIELRHIKMELVSPFTTSMGTEYDEEHIIVRVDGEGLTGWGECVAEGTPFYSYETVTTAWHILQDFLIPSILGKNILSIGDAIKAYSKVRGHRMAKAGLEAALWDLFAKSKNISLSKMMGGTKEKIDVGVSIGIQNSVEELIKKIEGYLSEGYKRIKIKIAPGKDIQFVRAVRKEFPDILFQVDANSAYSLDDIELLKQMDDYNLLLIEQPLGYEDIYAHSKLQKQLKTSICLDESIHSLDDTRAAIELDSCRVINIKPGRVGGFTESKLIHDYCASENIPVWCGGMLESGIGRAGNVALASLPNFTLPGDISASKRYYKEDIVEPEFVVNPDGTMNVPTKPGIGVEVNMKMLEKVTVRRAEFN